MPHLCPVARTPVSHAAARPVPLTTDTTAMHVDCAAAVALQGAGKPEDHFIIPPVYIGGEPAVAEHTQNRHAYVCGAAGGTLCKTQPAAPSRSWQQAGAAAPASSQHACDDCSMCSSDCAPVPLTVPLLKTCVPAALDAFLFLRDSKAFEEETHKILARTVRGGAGGLYALGCRSGVRQTAAWQEATHPVLLTAAASAARRDCLHVIHVEPVCM